MFCRHTSARRPHDQSVHQEIGLIDVFQRPGILPDGGRQSVKSHRPAAELKDHGVQDHPVSCIQSEPVHVQGAQGIIRGFRGDDALIADLGEIADPL